MTMPTRIRLFPSWLVPALALTVVGCGSQDARAEGTNDAAALAVAESSAPPVTFAGAHTGTVHVFKSPTCGCCNGWIEHMREAGFTVEAEDTQSLAQVKRELGIPNDLHSCHTAIVDGFVIEGHVPAETVAAALEDRGDLTGIAVPGMPIGSPGMEVPGRAADSYDVIGFTENGERRVVARH